MEPPITPPPVIEEAPKPGIALVALTTCIVVLNVAFAFAKSMRQTNDISYALGSGMSAIVFPIIVALLFSIAKRFRNPVARTKAVLWTSVLLLLANFASVAQQLPHAH